MVSYALAFALFANERGTSLRRAAENSAIERIAYTVDYLQNTPANERAALAREIRDYGKTRRYESDFHSGYESPTRNSENVPR
jgi:hypothetical protein